MTIKPNIEESWGLFLYDEFQSNYFLKLKEFLHKEKQLGKIIYPPGSEIFNAFELSPFYKTKVVILGQDPYHGPNQAHGLCFSVKDGVKTPPSLVNIYKEIEHDLGFKPPSHGNLTSWASQGVLLLNAILTVEDNQAASHHHQGWEQFTDAAIEQLSNNKDHLVFMLWGKYAQDKGSKIDRDKHLVLESTHPSPFSAYKGFLGCKHFSKTNSYLERHGLEPIDWRLG